MDEEERHQVTVRIDGQRVRGTYRLDLCPQSVAHWVLPRDSAIEFRPLRGESETRLGLVHPVER